MREKTIEKKLADAVKARGGRAPKFTSPGFDGMPDRIVLMPGGRIAFVEVKAPGKAPRPLQEARHRLLRRLGFQASTSLDDREPDWRRSLMKYVPHDYQQICYRLYREHIPIAAVLLDMGLGKTSDHTDGPCWIFCLTASRHTSVLVIAPLRVARDTWPAEIEKWDQLKTPDLLCVRSAQQG